MILRRLLFGRGSRVPELSATELHDALRDGRVTLVDVREPTEYAAERIDGALLFPLSCFDPAALPGEPGRLLVLQCKSGMRSAQAATKSAAAGVHVDGHLKGGISAWKASGFNTVTHSAGGHAAAGRR